MGNEASRRFFLTGRKPADPIIFGAACFATSGIVCQSCADQCPEAAIRFRPQLGGVPQPVLQAASCTGCGACVAGCPAGAIRLEVAHA